MDLAFERASLACFLWGFHKFRIIKTRQATPMHRYRTAISGIVLLATSAWILIARDQYALGIWGVLLGWLAIYVGVNLLGIPWAFFFTFKQEKEYWIRSTTADASPADSQSVLSRW